jgi:hypothetical protein
MYMPTKTKSIRMLYIGDIEKRYRERKERE